MNPKNLNPRDKKVLAGFLAALFVVIVYIKLVGDPPVSVSSTHPVKLVGDPPVSVSSTHPVTSSWGASAGVQLGSTSHHDFLMVLDQEMKERGLKAARKANADKTFDPNLGYGGTNVGMMWDFFEPSITCSTMYRVGRAGDGGKWTCNLEWLRDKENCVVYSFGSNGDISFEKELQKWTKGNCEIHIFDPTMTATFFREHPKYLNGPFYEELFSDDISAGPEALYKLGFYFHYIALAGKEEIIDLPRTPPDGKPGPVQAMTLSSVMAALGHSHVDIVKFDVEGAEWGLLQDWEKTPGGLEVDQLMVEMHLGGGVGVDHTTKTFEALYRLGYSIFFKEPVQYGPCGPWEKPQACQNIEYAFIKTDRAQVNHQDSQHREVLHSRTKAQHQILTEVRAAKKVNPLLKTKLTLD